MYCKNCNGTMIGNGFTTPIHCEYVDLPNDVEADSGPHFCNFEEEVMEKPNKNWQLTPVESSQYIPDAQEIAELEAIEKKQKQCEHKNFDNEDGCLDCGHYSK